MWQRKVIKTEKQRKIIEIKLNKCSGYSDCGKKKIFIIFIACSPLTCSWYAQDLSDTKDSRELRGMYIIQAKVKRNQFLDFKIRFSIFETTLYNLSTTDNHGFNS